MAKKKIEPSQQLAHEIATLIDGKPIEEIMAALCVIVANACEQSVAPDVTADLFHQNLKDTIIKIRKVLNKKNKIN